MEQITEQLIKLAVLVISFGLSVLTIYSAVWMAKIKNKAQKEIDKLDNEKDKEILNKELQLVNDTLLTNIIAFENTTKKQLQEVSADGKITREEIEKAGKVVVENTIKQMNDSTYEALKSITNDVDGYLKAKTEELLEQYKIEKVIIGNSITSDEYANALLEIGRLNMLLEKK